MNRTWCGALLALAACGAPEAPTAAAPASAVNQSMTITTAEERGTLSGLEQYFAGQSTVKMLFGPNGPRDFGGAYVTFETGARTAWHSHPAGQTLVVTEGSGWVQAAGGPRLDLKPGDVVWTPPGVRHWHGATASTSMTHMALQGAVDGSTVDWFEQVSDEQYLAARKGE